MRFVKGRAIMAEKVKSGTGGKRRARTKGLQKKLLQQIEFYFGDANLQKDRFLQQKMKEHPEGYISVETIASFNKMKSLTSDVQMVVQVMKTSNLVELSSDEKWVRRSVPLPTITDTDSRTVYVEHLPPSSDQDSVRKLLKVFGNIRYVSLPRHKVSGAIKGFAFVEFSTAEEATALLEYFKSGTKPATRHKPDSESKSEQQGKVGGGRKEGNGEEAIEEYHIEEGGKMEEGGCEEGVGDGRGRQNVVGSGTEEGKEVAREATDEVKHRKRKREEAIEGDNTEKPLPKKSKCNDGLSHNDRETAATTSATTDTAVITTTGNMVKPESVRVDMASDTGESAVSCAVDTTSVGTVSTLATVDTASVTAEATAQSRKEPKTEEQTRPIDAVAQTRKRRRVDDIEEEAEGGRRSDGKSAKLVDLKKVSGVSGAKGVRGVGGDDGDGDGGRVERLDSQTTDSGGEEGEAGGGKGQPKKRKKRNRQHKKVDWEAALKSLQLRVMAKKEWLEMRDIFRNLQKQKVREMKQQLKEEEEEGAVKGKREGGGYVGKCLVKVEGVGVGEGEELVTIEKVKEVCSNYGTVAYVDIKEGESEGYIRYAKSGCVENLVNAQSLTHVKFTSLPDEEERAYYLKTVAARKQLNRSGRGKKRNIRGQDKIISRALKHQSQRRQCESSSSSPVQAATHIRFSDSEHES